MRKSLFHSALALILAGGLPMAALAQTMDGSITAGEYGAGFEIAVQTTQTQFGDNTDASATTANGSELDSLSVGDDASFLYLGLAGNLETNWNKLTVYIDVDNNPATGRASDDGNSWGPFSNSNPSVTLPLGAEIGLIFGAGAGFFEVFVATFDKTTGAVLTNNSSGYAPPFTGAAWTAGSYSGTMALDNSNLAGVTGGTGAASGAGVTTGLEISLPGNLLKDANGGAQVLGNTVAVLAMVGNSGNDFLSNQILPGLATPAGNLGGGTVNMSGFSVATYTVAAVPVELSGFSLD